MFGLPITWGDVLDILLFAGILFGIYQILKRSGATNLFWGIFAFLAVWVFIRNVLHLGLTGAFFDRIIDVGAIAIIVIFQEEIRTFFYNLGSRFSGRLTFRGRTMSNEETTRQTAMMIVRACQDMSRTKTGALIVLAGHHDLKAYADTGERIDARLSTRLIENIFFKNSPLHDGALIVDNNRILAAGAILPVSKDTTIPQSFGLRHRAALGITEMTGATAIVVSEETGHISVAQIASLTDIATISDIDESELLPLVIKALGMQ